VIISAKRFWALAGGLAVGVVVLAGLGSYWLGVSGASDLAAEMPPPPRPEPAAHAKGVASDEGARPTLRRIRGTLPPNAPAPIVARDAAEKELDDEEFVLGVLVGAEARAYPFNMLARPDREILNDDLGGRPIVVTWCSQCQSPVVFDRRLRDQTLTFRVSGETAEENMVLQDLETGSRFVQILGTAVAGPLKGERLASVPAIWTDWETWREKHPETTVALLSRTTLRYRHSGGYGADPDEREYFDRLQWGLAQEGAARSWPFEDLASPRGGIVNDSFQGRSLALFFDRSRSTVTAFDRKTAGRVLTFRSNRHGEILDDQTHSTWEPLTGVAVSGPLKGHRLDALAGVVSKSDAWARLHPRTEVWSGPPLKQN
jgi:hypothetical protein